MDPMSDLAEKGGDDSSFQEQPAPNRLLCSGKSRGGRGATKVVGSYPIPTFPTIEKSASGK